MVDRSLVDDAMPQLLGAQVQLGRWAPAGPDTPSGVRRPASAPEAGIDVERLAVVVGDYQSERGVRPLPFALEEGRAITETYPSVWVKGTLDEVTALLEGRLAADGMPATAQVVHVACHGAIDPRRPAYSGIVLSDSALRIDELTVLGGELGDAGAPLVFLNACQLGQAHGELLGDQGGLASAFLAVGCRGFLAPLWAVEDDLARDLALDFYRYTLGDGLTVGAALRRLRGRFANIPGAPERPRWPTSTTATPTCASPLAAELTAYGAEVNRATEVIASGTAHALHLHAPFTSDWRLPAVNVYPWQVSGALLRHHARPRQRR